MNIFLPRGIQEIEQLLAVGNFKDADLVISRFEKNSDLSIENQLELKLYRCHLFIYEGALKKAYTISKEVLDESEGLDYFLVQLHSLNIITEILWRDEQISESYSMLKKGEQLFLSISEKSDFLEAYLLYNKAIIFDKKGLLKDALEYQRRSLEIRTRIQNSFAQGLSLSHIGYLHQRLGKPKLALSHYNESLQLFRGLRCDYGTAFSLYMLANYYIYMGNLELALEHNLEALTHFRKISNRKRIATSLHAIAMTYWRLGELNKALDYNKKSLLLFEDLGNKKDIASALFGIGGIYQRKGELDAALEFVFKSLNLHRQLADRNAESYALLSIGMIYHYKGDLERASEYINKSMKNLIEFEDKYGIAFGYTQLSIINQLKGNLEQSLENGMESLIIRIDLLNQQDIAESLLQIISIYVDLENNQEASNYLKMLSKIREEELGNKIIDQTYRVAQGLYLKSSKRSRNIVRATEIFEEIISEEIVLHSLTITSLYNLCELLLFELKIFNNIEILDKLEDIIQQLLNIAKKQQSFILLAETFYLQAQLALLKMDIERSRTLLYQGQIIAEDKGLIKLARKISAEHDALLDKVALWNESVEKDDAYKARIGLSMFEESVSRKVRNLGIESPEMKEEDPILLLILDNGGLTAYSKRFTKMKDFNEQLIGGFLSAINIFMKETFSTVGAVERIKHQDYTLLISAQDPLLFCYVVRGPSYTALHKLELLISKVQNLPNLWASLTGRIQRGITLRNKEIGAIDKIIENIFLERKTSFVNEIFEKENEILTPIKAIKFIGKKALNFKNAGYDTIRKIANATVDDLVKIKRVGPYYAKQIISSAKEIIINRNHMKLNETNLSRGKNSLIERIKVEL